MPTPLTLVVDDEPDSRDLLDIILTRIGIGCVTAATLGEACEFYLCLTDMRLPDPDGRDGLFLATSEPFDLVIVDRMLPGLDGLAIIQALRDQGHKTPILILSALAQVDDRARGLRAGGDDYLTKPYSFAELMARIEALLRPRPPSPPWRWRGSTWTSRAAMTFRDVKSRAYRSVVHTGGHWYGARRLMPRL